MIHSLLAAAARHGKLLLVAGLIAGIALPELALAMRPGLPWMIATLLFLAALRIGPRRAVDVAGGLRHALGALLVLQLVMPMAAAVGFAALGLHGPLATSLVLMAAAAPISGSAGLAIMTGQDPAPALRLMVLGTALLPVTVLPILLVAPALGSFADVLAAAVRLALVIVVCSGAAFAVRHWMRAPGPDFFVRTDGAVAVMMAVLVIALMSAVAPALRTEPGTVALYCAVAFVASFGLQVAATLALRAAGRGAEAGAYGICAGNRNIGLFLTALPAPTTDPLLLFIGCYQIPMYLTPLMLRRFYGAAVPEPRS